MEILNAAHPRGPFRTALLDFDGTLSLLRRGWQQVMIPMAVEHLAATTTSETEPQLHSVVEEFVTRLTGKQTIYQMIQLGVEVEKRGGVPSDPLDYKREYHERLWSQVQERIKSVEEGRTTAESMTVPGSAQLLQKLTACGVDCHLASGTDEPYVLAEAALLGLDQYFEGRIYGARDDFQNFSKAKVIERILREAGMPGSRILGLGDGFVEIEEIKRVGGLAIGVASNEFTRSGIDSWKRARLAEAGADIILADYGELEALCDRLQICAA